MMSEFDMYGLKTDGLMNDIHCMFISIGWYTYRFRVWGSIPVPYIRQPSFDGMYPYSGLTPRFYTYIPSVTTISEKK